MRKNPIARDQCISMYQVAQGLKHIQFWSSVCLRTEADDDKHSKPRPCLIVLDVQILLGTRAADGMLGFSGQLLG